MKFINKSLIVLISCFYLTSCNNVVNNSNNSDNSFDSESTAPSISDSTSEPIPESSWNEKISYDMIVALGETIPYISSFGNNPQYYFKTDNSGTPYINPYIENPTNNPVQNYITASLSANYVYYSDGDEEGVHYYYYRKYSGDDYLELKFGYYANAGSNWFDLYAYLNNPGGGLPIPTACDFSLAPSDFSSSYVDKTLQKDGNEILTTYVMNYSNRIQLKQGQGLIYNNNPSKKLLYLYIDSPNNISYVKVYGGKSATSLNVLPTFNCVYYLAGYQYFKIECPSNAKVFTCDSIDFIYK